MSRLPFHERGAPDTLKILGDVVIHDSAKIWSGIDPVSMVALENGRIVIGADTFINHGVWIRALDLVWIAECCRIGPRVMIMDHDMHGTTVDRTGRGKILEVKIFPNVWIGAAAIILKGVHIGQHSVVGAGSVVTKHVPEKTVVAGNPAKKINEVQE